MADRSAELGPVEAVFNELAAELAAKEAAAIAARDKVEKAIKAIRWRAVEQEAYRRWRAAPHELPAWLTGEGWPEPDDQEAAA